MEEIRCSACGSTALEYANGRYTCTYCGTQYKSESEDASPATVDANVGIEESLKKADIYWKFGQKERARAIYRTILEQNSRCEIARERLGR